MPVPGEDTIVLDVSSQRLNQQAPRKASFAEKSAPAPAFPRMKSFSPIIFDSHAPLSYPVSTASPGHSYYRILSPAVPSQQLSTPPRTLNQSAGDDVVINNDVGFVKSTSGSRPGSMAPNDAPYGSSMVMQTQTPETANQIPRQLHMEGSFSPQNGYKYSGKHKSQYMMADGSVVSGKGLGRGRPGVKRGPRKSKLGSELSGDGETTMSIIPTAETSTAESMKRKRTDSEASLTKASDHVSVTTSRESTPEYNPTSTQTRSGRQSQKPAPIIAPASASASPATKKQSSSGSTSSPLIKKHPKIKAKVYRGREQFALCEHCLRGHGPTGNVIVFCDACNKCWHQNCHVPRISKEIVADSKAEWFCTDCDRILHGKKKSKPAPPQFVAPAVTAIAPSTQQGHKFGPPLVGAASLTLAQRKEYLGSLSRERLIDLILRAGDLAPQLPMFESPVSQPPPVPVYAPAPQPQFASNYVTPVDKTPTVPAEPEDEGYDDSFDEHAALYPKPGEGVRLPPESVDLHMLLEGPDSRTFSHWVRGMPVKTSL